MTLPKSRRFQAMLCALLLLIVNLLIAGKLFAVEYSAYTGSIEGTFISIPRIIAKYPGQWQWWPFWNGGLPFEVAYLPLTHWIVAGFSLVTGLSAARSFHIVTAGIYVLSALAVFWMVLALSRRLIASLIAALAYSCVSVSSLLVPAIGADAGGVLNLRRLQLLVFYGESPHTAALALLPVAIVCFSRALTTRSVKWQLLAGVSAAFVALSNAFGIVMLAIALLCWLIAFPLRPWWRAPLTVAAVGAAAYCWISPWLSPAMIRAIRANSATTGGDFRYKGQTWIALALVGGGFLLLGFALRRFKVFPPLRFFILFAYVPTALVLIWSIWEVALIPQPNRYHLEVDMGLPIALVFAGSSMLERLPRRARAAVAAVAIGGLTAQTIHATIYARDLIRSVEPAQLSEYKIAKWLDRNRPGERAFISGSGSFLYNVFTDNPQLAGGHDQHTVNSFIPIVGFTIYTGMNAGDRDADYSIFWLKAFGTHLISVPGAGSNDYYKPIVHPHKFDGILPLLWREGDASIYEVPSRSSSLAHVIPASAIVTRTPIHGLDIAPVEAYVAALEDPRFPPATFRWTAINEADIGAILEPGQLISVQVTHERGWEAWANGKRQPVFGDAIGQVVIQPDSIGPCRITLRYTGGWEHLMTRAMSLSAMVAALVFGWRGRRTRLS